MNNATARVMTNKKVANPYTNGRQSLRSLCSLAALLDVFTQMSRNSIDYSRKDKGTKKRIMLHHNFICIQTALKLGVEMLPSTGRLVIALRGG